MKRIIIPIIIIIALIALSLYFRFISQHETQQTVGGSSQHAPSFADGQYIGNSEDAFYGPLQVTAIIANGQLTNVEFITYPHDLLTSQSINQTADPQLIQEAIAAQSANVQIISGATVSSQAFIKSLQSALQKAEK